MNSSRNCSFYKLTAVTIMLVWVLVGCRETPDETIPASPLPSPAPLVSPLDSPLVSPSPTSLWPAGKVLYHSDQTGEYQIHLVVDGQPAVALTGAPGSAVEAAWSPDGQRIAFAADRPDAAGIGIYTMRADGSDQARLMPDQPQLNWRPNWSPDGTQLVFLSNRDGNFEIYKVNADGTGLVNLTKHQSNDLDADWSPDGSKIVFVSNRDAGNSIYTMDADGSNVTKLRGGFCSFPRWSPDGEKIAFALGKDSISIYVMNADGSDAQQVTDEAEGNSTTPSWVGNDRLIFSSEKGDLNWDLFLVNVDGTGLVRLTTTKESERFPSWTP